MKIKRKIFESYYKGNKHVLIEYYNEDGNIKQKHDGKKDTYFYYNDNGLICRTKQGDEEHIFFYNEDNKISRVERNGVTQYEYNYPSPFIVESIIGDYTSTRVYKDPEHKYVLEEFDTNGYHGWTTYDEENNVIKTKDNNDNSREYEYENGKLIKEFVHREGDGIFSSPNKHSVLENKYDEKGNLIEVVVDGKTITERLYDERNNKITEKSVCDGYVTRYQYNEHNDVIRFDAGDDHYGTYQYEYW